MKSKSISIHRVRLEPELEAIAASWSAAKRFENGRKFIRWGRELIISGRIMSRDARATHQPRTLKRLPARKAILN